MGRSKRTRSRSAYSRLAETEAAARQRRPAGKRAAQSAWKSLSEENQLALIREIVETRSAELVRAYRSVVEVVPGRRRRRSAGSSRRSGKSRKAAGAPRTRVLQQLCVVFLVKRKWKKGARGNPDQRIPDRLYAYWEVDGARRLCAVPTDVVSAGTDLSLKPQAAHQRVNVDPKRDGVKWGVGAITCVVVRHGSSNPTRRYALSCRHVFSISTHISWPVWNTGVYLPDQQTLVGHARGVFGHLRAAVDAGDGRLEKLSFDAQLAEVSDEGVLRKTLAGHAFSGVARGALDLPMKLRIHVPGQSTPRRAEFLAEHQLYAIDYAGAGVRAVFPLVYLMHVPDGTRAGDSGSPVSDPDSGRLVGMLIAGNTSAKISAMLPAWQLFDPTMYKGANDAERWELVAPV